jgi:hypothetical protein
MKAPVILRTSFQQLKDCLANHHRVLLAENNAAEITDTINSEVQAFLPVTVKNHTARIHHITVHVIRQLACVIQHIHKQKIPDIKCLGFTQTRSHLKYRVQPAFIKKVIRNKFAAPTPKYYLKCGMCWFHQQETILRPLLKQKYKPTKRHYQ